MAEAKVGVAEVLEKLSFQKGMVVCENFLKLGVFLGICLTHISYLILNILKY